MIHDNRKRELALYSVNTLTELLEDLDLGEEFIVTYFMFQPITCTYKDALDRLKNKLGGS